MHKEKQKKMKERKSQGGLMNNNLKNQYEFSSKKQIHVFAKHLDQIEKMIGALISEPTNFLGR